MKPQVTETKFSKICRELNFETAVIVFQDKISESDKSEFNIAQWIAVLKLTSGSIHLEAWTKIQEMASKLDYQKSRRCFLNNYNNDVIRSLMLNRMCRTADRLEQISECINTLEEEDEKLPGLLEKLSKADGSFETWTEVFFSSEISKVKEIAFLRTQESEAEFKNWLELIGALRLEKHKSFLPKGFATLKTMAITFSDKQNIYYAFGNESFLASEMTKLLKSMKDTAEKAEELVWIYDRDPSNDLKGKILRAKDSFNNWSIINQGLQDGWLKSLSLKRMKETAETFDHQDRIWRRDSSESGKKEACSNMIKMASIPAEAKLAWQRARGTPLEEEARKKLEQLAG